MCENVAVTTNPQTLFERNRSKLFFCFFLFFFLFSTKDLLNPKAIGIPTITYRFGSQLSEDKEPERQEEVKEPERQEVKKPRQIVRRKKLEIDTEWIKNKMEVRGQDAGIFTVCRGFCFCFCFFGSGETHTHTPIRELSEPTQNLNTNEKKVSDV